MSQWNYVEHLRKEFYEVLPGSRPLVIAAPDVDSVCTVKILQHLFDLDGIAHTLVCADGYSELKSHFQEFREQVKNVILINCGGTVDILDLLEDPKDVTIFIVDSHRPTHILNIYDESQRVKIVIPAGEDEKIPLPDVIFPPDDIEESDENEESDEDEDNEEEGSEDSSRPSRNKRRRRDEKLERRRRLTEWQKKRNDALTSYIEYSYYGAPASLIMLEVAWTMSRGGAELVWYSIVGLTDYFVMNKMERQNYVLLAHQLQTHVNRLKHSQLTHRDAVKLAFENEICLYLYRHWNIYESLEATPYFACKFKFWLGDKNLNRFLLDVGLPLSECRQKFVAMDLEIRNHLKEMLQKKSDKWNLQEITVPSFTRQIGMKRRHSAIDCHLSALSILENCEHESNLSEKFKAALDCLPPERLPELDKGMESAKLLLKTIHRQVQAFLDTHTIINVGPFLLASITEGSLDVKYFVNQNSLILLARFTQRAAVESAKNRSKFAKLPLILVVPESQDVFLLIGLPPMAAHNSNMLGRIFERIGENLVGEVAMDSFESFIVQVSADKKKKFVDKLIDLLEE